MQAKREPYPSSVTQKEWVIVKPLLPKPGRLGRRGSAVAGSLQFGGQLFRLALGLGFLIAQRFGGARQLFDLRSQRGQRAILSRTRRRGLELVVFGREPRGTGLRLGLGFLKAGDLGGKFVTGGGGSRCSSAAFF